MDTTTQLKQLLKQARINPYFSLGLAMAFLMSLVVALIVIWLPKSADEIPFPDPTPTPSTVTELPSTIELVEINGELVPSGLPVVYQVQPGDSSWRVAEAFYGSGFNYVDIEEANELLPGSLLEIGQELVIPAKPIRVLSVIEKPRQVVEAPSDTAQNDTNLEMGDYSIHPGDSLWKIADRELGDPHRWVEIYELNRDAIGLNPDLIYPNTSLALPK